MTFKKDVEESINKNVEETEDSMNQINVSFFSALEDEKKEKEHQQFMDGVLSAWLALMFANFEEDLYNSAQVGIDEADKQLKSKNITTVADKNITVETYEKQVQTRLDSVKSDLVTVAEEIKTNNSSIFKDLNATITREQREKLSKELLNVLKKNGITHFYDKAGRQWQIETYIKMRTLTESMQAERLSFFTRATQYGVDLVRIIHLNLHPQCELCIPFNGKILSINGKTPGYMTIQEAALHGLFHPNCDHISEELELAPEDNGGEGEINLNEANQKRADYNTKKNFQMF